MISFVIPAHNEEACLPPTLRAIHASAAALGEPYEILVVNDASTDATADVAQKSGARVVLVQHRQIAATRNSGARAAQGDYIFFIDADTTANPKAVAAGLRAMKNGAAGGGAATKVARGEWVPLYLRLIIDLQLVFVKLAGFTGGAFMFCTREAFHATGGFNERLFCGEEGDFALALKREGRFFVLWQRVATSGRRGRTTSGLQVIALCARVLVAPRKTVMQRSGGAKIWYDSNRSRDNHAPNTIAARLSNGIALVVVLMLLSSPFWNLIPRAWTPLAFPLGKIRLSVAILVCHLGVILFPAVAVALIRNLFRQKRWAGSLHTLLLLSFCVWQSWASAHGVFRLWSLFLTWVRHFFA
jgi:glycosyltransferase involved in cell wall biosynthesis